LAVSVRAENDHFDGTVERCARKGVDPADVLRELPGRAAHGGACHGRMWVKGSVPPDPHL
jgi:hypothetical protein